MFTYIHNKLQQRGFTVLMASLVASLLLVLGAAMFGLVRKEIILSSIGRDSQFAFYAADTGAECALYWDFRYQAFTQTPGPAVACGGETIGTFDFPGYGTPMTFEYNPNGYCARVTVTKHEENPRTEIEARGYSTTCGDIASNPRALERAVRITY